MGLPSGCLRGLLLADLGWAASGMAHCAFGGLAQEFGHRGVDWRAYLEVEWVQWFRSFFGQECEGVPLHFDELGELKYIEKLVDTARQMRTFGRF